MEMYVQFKMKEAIEMHFKRRVNWGSLLKPTWQFSFSILNKELRPIYIEHMQEIARNLHLAFKFELKLISRHEFWWSLLYCEATSSQKKFTHFTELD